MPNSTTSMYVFRFAVITFARLLNQHIKFKVFKPKSQFLTNNNVIKVRSYELNILWDIFGFCIFTVEK